MSKTILVICRNQLEKAPRFLMEISALKNSYKILAAGLSSSQTKDYEFISIEKRKSEKNINYTFHHKYPTVFKKTISLAIQLLFIRSYLKHKHQDKIEKTYSYNQLKKYHFNLIIVHHLNDLPLAVKLAKQNNTKIIFNAHEYYPLEFDNDENWMKTIHPKYMSIAKNYLKHVDICFCVGEKIAEKYKKEFNLNSIVITNAKPYQELKPNEIGEDAVIKLIHHGIANRTRKLEAIIEVLKYLGNNYSLDFMLVPADEKYFEELKLMSNSVKNINFIKTVDTPQIARTINSHDIGIYILPNNNFNNTYALPNKFFEFIQARLAIAIAPSPEMAAIVNKYDLGVIANDFTPKALAEKIKSLSAKKIMYYKNQSHKYAHELSVEINELIIKETVDELLQN